MGASMLRKLFIVLIAAALAVVLYPLLNERTWSPCAALEYRFLGLVLAGGDAGDVLGAAVAKEAMGVGDGQFAEAVARQLKPGVATFATCYSYYWHSVYDRKWLLDFGYLHFAK